MHELRTAIVVFTIADMLFDALLRINRMTDVLGVNFDANSPDLAIVFA